MMIKDFEKRILSSIILIPTATFFIIKGSVLFLSFLSILFLITSYEWLKMCKKKKFIKIFRNNIFFIFFLFYIFNKGRRFKIFFINSSNLCIH